MYTVGGGIRHSSGVVFTLPSKPIGSDCISDELDVVQRTRRKAWDAFVQRHWPVRVCRRWCKAGKSLYEAEHLEQTEAHWPVAAVTLVATRYRIGLGADVK